MGMTLSDRQKKARGKYIIQNDSWAGLADDFIIVDHAMNSRSVLRCVCPYGQTMNFPDLSYDGLRMCRVFKIYKNIFAVVLFCEDCS